MVSHASTPIHLEVAMSCTSQELHEIQTFCTENSFFNLLKFTIYSSPYFAQTLTNMAAVHVRGSSAQDYGYGAATSTVPYPAAAYPPAAYQQQAPGYPYPDARTEYPVPPTYVQPGPAAYPAPYPAPQPLPAAGQGGSYCPSASCPYGGGLRSAYPPNAGYPYGARPRQPFRLPFIHHCNAQHERPHKAARQIT